MNDDKREKPWKQNGSLSNSEHREAGPSPNPRCLKDRDWQCRDPLSLIFPLHKLALLCGSDLARERAGLRASRTDGLSLRI